MIDLDSTFAALSHSARRAILQRLLEGETPLSELAEPFDMTQTAVSKHVRILAEAGLVSVELRGRTRYCSLHAEPMKSATEWLVHYRAFWERQFDNLARHLAEEDGE